MATIEKWNCEDIDQQSESLPGWEQQYYQLGCGKFNGTVATARSGQVTLIRETTNQALHENVVAPRGQTVFAFALNEGSTLAVDRKKVDRGTLLILEGGRCYDFRTTGYVQHTARF